MGPLTLWSGLTKAQAAEIEAAVRGVAKLVTAKVPVGQALNRLGTGCCGTAYEIPSPAGLKVPLVLKVNRFGDAGCHMWQWAIREQERRCTPYLPYMPRVFAYADLRVTSQGGYIVVTERVDTSYETRSRFDTTVVGGTSTSTDKYLTMVLKGILGDAGILDMTDGEGLSGMSNGLGGARGNVDEVPSTPGVEFLSSDIWLDVHEGNWGVAKGRRTVAFDPLAGGRHRNI